VKKRPPVRAIISLMLLYISSCAPTQEDPVERVRIGMLVSLTGDLATLGKGFLDASNLAVEEINAGGGVRGKRLQLVLRDDATTVPGAEKGFASLASQGVKIMLGPTTSAQVQQLAPEFVGRGILAIGRTTSAQSLSAISPLFLRLAPSDDFQAKLIASLLQRDGIRQICALHRADSYGTGLYKRLQDSLSGSNVRVVEAAYNGDNKSTYPRVIDTCNQACDFDVTKQRCKPNPTSALVLISFLGDAVELLDLAYERGWSGKNQRLYAAETLRDELAPLIMRHPEAIEGLIGTAPSGPTADAPSGPVARSFAARFRERFGRDAPNYAANGYDSVYIASIALELADSEDAASVRNAVKRTSSGTNASPGEWSKTLATLRSSGSVDYLGASGTVDVVEETGDVKPPYFFTVYTFRNGTLIDTGIERVE
jgi:ABC-type branched-subunit amino acid transport system substrate-binding protein